MKTIINELDFLKKTVIKTAIKSKLIDLLTQLKGFKFVTTLVLVFKKVESEDKTKCDTFYSNSEAEIIINEINIDVFQSISINLYYNYIKHTKIFRKSLVQEKSLV